MILDEDLVGCRIIIRGDKSDEVISDTNIIGYDREKDVISLSSYQVSYIAPQQVRALLFAPSGLKDCMGSMDGRVVSGAIKVHLYRALEKNDRGCMRYPVNMSGVLKTIIDKQGVINDSYTFAIRILNMSASGLLISAPSGHIKEGDILEMTARKNSVLMHITCKVVRTQNLTVQSEEYGCSIISVENQ